MSEPDLAQQLENAQGCLVVALGALTAVAAALVWWWARG